MTSRRKSGELLRQTGVHPLGRITLAGLFIEERVPRPTPMRFWDTYAVVYVLAGRAEFHDETGLSLPLRPGNLLLMFPGHGYHYDVDPSLPWSEFALHFQGPIFDLWRELKIIDPARPVYHLRPIPKWFQRFEQFVQDCRSHGRAKHPRTDPGASWKRAAKTSPPARTASFSVDLGALTASEAVKQVCRWQTILADITAEGRGKSEASPQSLWLAQASAILDALPASEPVDWTAVSARMGLSYDRFRKKFAQASGTPPAKYFMARRLETACQMLENRKLGLKEIARACGFCDPFQFSKQFKKGLRLTPTEYREFKLHGPYRAADK